MRARPIWPLWVPGPAGGCGASRFPGYIYTTMHQVHGHVPQGRQRLQMVHKQKTMSLRWRWFEYLGLDQLRAVRQALWGVWESGWGILALQITGNSSISAQGVCAGGEMEIPRNLWPAYTQWHTQTQLSRRIKGCRLNQLSSWKGGDGDRAWGLGVGWCGSGYMGVRVCGYMGMRTRWNSLEFPFRKFQRQFHSNHTRAPLAPQCQSRKAHNITWSRRLHLTTPTLCHHSAA